MSGDETSARIARMAENLRKAILRQRPELVVEVDGSRVTVSEPGAAPMTVIDVGGLPTGGEGRVVPFRRP